MMLFASGTVANILRVAWTAILASVLVSVLFSAAVVGLIRAGELRRASRGAVAAAYTAAALVGLMLCGAAVVYGIVLVGQKS